MSWEEISIWALIGFAGLINAIGFGHSLGAPMRMRKMLDSLPKVPEPTPYEGLPLYRIEDASTGTPETKKAGPAPKD